MNIDYSALFAILKLYPTLGSNSREALTVLEKEFYRLQDKEKEFERAVVSWKSNEEVDSEIIASLTEEVSLLRDRLQQKTETIWRLDEERQRLREH